ncbi:hypothetical protein HID58_094834 [Brassica napus]|uniref:Uncharacterized protein n=1 Tax=Brassica napus TaxID=3708 RepID=A0ABQ7X5X1_BRANA|nr:hypothetical protein HID58_094834 [Brassica napus]
MEANLDPSSSAFIREVEAYSDPLSPTLASGKGSLLQPARRLAKLRCRLETRDSKSVEISVIDGTRRREDSAVKNGYGFVGGLSVSKLRRTQV